MLKLLRAQSPVLTREDGSDFRAGELQHKVFSSVFRQDRDAVAVPHAEAHHRMRGAIYGVVERRIAEAFSAVFNRNTLRKQPRLRGEQATDRARRCAADEGAG